MMQISPGSLIIPERRSRARTRVENLEPAKIANLPYLWPGLKDYSSVKPGTKISLRKVEIPPSTEGNELKILDAFQELFPLRNITYRIGQNNGYYVGKYKTLSQIQPKHKSNFVYNNPVSEIEETTSKRSKTMKATDRRIEAPPPPFSRTRTPSVSEKLTYKSVDEPRDIRSRLVSSKPPFTTSRSLTYRQPIAPMRESNRVPQIGPIPLSERFANSEPIFESEPMKGHPDLKNNIRALLESNYNDQQLEDFLANLKRYDEGILHLIPDLVRRMILKDPEYRRDGSAIDKLYRLNTIIKRLTYKSGAGKSIIISRLIARGNSNSV